MYQKNGKNLFKMSALAVAVASVATMVGCKNDNSASADEDQALTRFATVPLGAEITGLALNEDGDLFFNVQHPDDANTATDDEGKTFDRAAVGTVAGYQFDKNRKTLEILPLPQTTEEKQLVRTGAGSYHVIAQEQDDFAGAIPDGLGAIVSTDGQSLIKVSNDPDFNAFISLGNNEAYLFTNWEDRPGGMSRLKLRRTGGTWEVADNEAMMLDFSDVNGTWVNCFGSLSPWNTPLTSEELYFDDTADWNNPNYDYHGDQVNLENYLGHYSNPYDYGYILEIQDPTSAAPKPVKMFAMGRFSHENSVVMPDQKTVYLSDDGTGTVFFKFVADKAADLSAGTLYAAKATQDDTKDPTEAGFDIEWIELASGSNAEIESWIREYDGIDTTDYVEGSTSYISDEEINNWAENKLQKDLDGDSTIENDSFGDDRVAFLEARKAAKALGATAEFRKMEGVRINLAGATDGSVPYAYMSMSEFNKTMADDEGDIQLDGANANCGAVYQMALGNEYNISRMEPVLVGGPYDEAAAPNSCSTDNIANPDNLLVLNDGNVIVGEDTGEHENNMLWLFNPAFQAK
ncbi:DUF839 domain-containing protein [Marinobacteraceae bacterium S3BR75-40.1]